MGKITSSLQILWSFSAIKSHIQMVVGECFFEYYLEDSILNLNNTTQLSASLYAQLF